MSGELVFLIGGLQHEGGQKNAKRGTFMKRTGKRASSPCIDVCRHDPKTRWCLGCGRTADEIGEWSKLTPFRRRRLQQELAHRLIKLKNAHDNDKVAE